MSKRFRIGQRYHADTENGALQTLSIKNDINRTFESGVTFASDNDNEIEIKLQSKKRITDDTYLFTFDFNDESKELGLYLGGHIKLRAQCMNYEAKEMQFVERKYTPTSPIDMKGKFEIPIKIYNRNTHAEYPFGGIMTQHLDEMKPGDTINCIGPKGKLKYFGNGVFEIRQKQKDKNKDKTGKKKDKKDKKKMPQHQTMEAEYEQKQQQHRKDEMASEPTPAVQAAPAIKACSQMKTKIGAKRNAAQTTEPTKITPQSQENENETKPTIKKTKLGMIAGGSGITPLYSIIQASCMNYDCVEISLIFGNKTESDIILRKELESFYQQNPKFIHCHFLIDQAPVKIVSSGQSSNVSMSEVKSNSNTSIWKDDNIGYIRKELIEKYMPPPGDETLILYCGPSAMKKVVKDILFNQMNYNESKHFHKF